MLTDKEIDEYKFKLKNINDFEGKKECILKMIGKLYDMHDDNIYRKLMKRSPDDSIIINILIGLIREENKDFNVDIEKLNLKDIITEEYAFQKFYKHKYLESHAFESFPKLERALSYLEE